MAESNEPPDLLTSISTSAKDEPLEKLALADAHRRRASNPEAYAHKLLEEPDARERLLREHEDRTFEGKTRAALETCTKCDKAGIRWFTRDGNPSSYDNPAAKVGEKCSHAAA